ncbi:MAG: tRNA (adenine(22)-N(1))-methyltransferase TrmK [Alistipes sp.]|nr:tRNA (adenine(22)-N(1))-methyltransferase TrmK [Alistipes sp.]
MFHFKCFSVDDAMCAMKVGTDGVLLGAWADVSGARRILDIGTGSGLIALMAAQHNSMARIEAIDIDEGAVEQAQANIAMSSWSERISVSLSDVRAFASEHYFDHIVTNPPFFNHSLPSPDERRAMARHCSSLSYDDIVASAERLLCPGGRLSLILPADEAFAFRSAAFGHLWLRRETTIVTRAGDAPKRTMMEFVLCDEPLMPHVNTIAIHASNGEYSDEYRNLVGEYYLKF